jgi:glycine cleavage system transcriptional repressor
MKQMNCLLTVTGKDRAGIIAEITGILYQLGFNLEDIAMTILEGQFAMMLVFSGGGGPSGRKKLGLLNKHLKDCENHGRLFCHLNPLTGPLKRGGPQDFGTTRHLISALGRDKTGIVHKISRVLAQNRLNITDLNSQILGYGKRCLYSMLLEVDVPKSFPVSRLTRVLKRLQHELKVEIQIKPAERLEL